MSYNHTILYNYYSLSHTYNNLSPVILSITSPTIYHYYTILYNRTLSIILSVYLLSTITISINNIYICTSNLSIYTNIPILYQSIYLITKSTSKLLSLYYYLCPTIYIVPSLPVSFYYCLTTILYLLTILHLLHCYLIY